MVVEETPSRRVDPAMTERLIDLQRDLHRHPELSNDEHMTALRTGSEFASLGCGDVHEVAGTGLVLDVRGERVAVLLTGRSVDLDHVVKTESVHRDALARRLSQGAL